ncbi:MAG: ABC transporter permease, partial [Brachybacterium tyrofermentans]
MTTGLDTEVENTPASTPAPRRKRSGGGLGRYILVRFLLIIPTVFILMTVVFFLMRIT